MSFWPQYAEDFYRKANVSEIQQPKEKFTIVFTGNIGYAQGLEILPKAAELLKGENVHFLIVGDGRYREQFCLEIQKRNVEAMFTQTGRKKPEEVPQYLERAQVAFISFMQEPLFEQTIPAKLQSYMACGKPILAAASGETKRIVEEAGCGLCCPIGDVQQLAKQIRVLMSCSNLAVMGNNALEYLRKNFDKHTLLEEMDTYLKGDIKHV